ncbi:nucleotide sugar dehydrogenase [Thalassospiraceae bacterium LMO-SO8]|nr:nucleotide sugar dehydrogenase [Alphaproteobacteria bacterium LMO-S08]WND77615.1 nucleotide sugar dehydrogenase [Thalassospiraceae bacterium LMO-SO8]
MTVQRSISVIGLGYVGLPVAVAFGRAGFSVVAFDISAPRLDELRAGHDRTHEVEAADLAAANLTFTDNPADLAKADFHIVTVPTPIDGLRRPDLGPLTAATETLGAVLKKGDIVVYESTVYPGATEEECVPILADRSGLAYGRDFFVGYSPERINPGDREHRFETIKKVVSGCDAQTARIVADTYGAVVTAGVHMAPTIKTAEAAKVIENTQRDLNIALMNELALIFDRLGIDTSDVLAAAGTKWNFLPFTPGLVGGHCIGVDPYYLTHRAEMAGYRPEVILAGRRINDEMGPFIARETMRRLSKRGGIKSFRVTILGLTFKENVPDVRNTKVIDIAHELERFGAEVTLHDPMADRAEVKHEFGVELAADDALGRADAVILAVPHEAYLARGWDWIAGLLADDDGLVVDVRARLARDGGPSTIELWRL